MTTVEFLSHLRSLDVKLLVVDGRLHLNAPDGVLTPQLRAEIAERKVGIITFLHGAREAIQSAAAPITPVSREGDLPLSFAQQRMWFLDQLEPGSPFYNVPNAVHLSGRLDVVALEQSLNEIVRRHQALRTTFAMADGRAIQVITPVLTVELPVVDLQELAGAKQETLAQQIATEEAQQSFNLVRGPLIRITLLRLGDEEHILLLTLHHIISDGWSGLVLIRELITFYQAFVTKKPSPLPELPIQYVDFAVWQRQWLQGQVLEEQVAYWKQQLDGAPAILKLPTDRPRPARQTFNGVRQSFRLPECLIEALRTISQQEETTLYMTLLAVFKTLLYRYTGQEDILVGTPIANRNRAEIEGLIGFFVNTLVLRTDLSGNPSFRELLGRVHKVSLGAYAHQDVPFEILVEELHLGRSLSYHPLFQVMFVLQNMPLRALSLPGLVITPREVESGTARFDLTLYMEETRQGLVGAFEYNTDLFDMATIKRMAGHFRMLLEGIVADPDRRIADLPLLTECEWRQLLDEWNDTKIEYPQGRCIHELFEAQVERTPEAVAVSFEDRYLTFRQLSERANQLAHYLQKLDIGPEVIVGICVERSLEMVIGLLGVLKTGGAYLPLDPTYPQERLAFMLQDSQAPMLLTQQRLASSLPGHGARVVYLDAHWQAIAQESATNPVSDVSAQNVAYVIYTSGSTGKPKGVMVAHQGLGNLAEAQIRVFGVRPESRVLQFAAFSFDASVSEVLMALLAGAPLCLGSLEAVWPRLDLLQFFQEQAITTVTLPPSALMAMTAVELPALHTLVAAGEACPPEVAVCWANGHCFFNAYGPTEASVCATIAEYQADTRRPGIGRPIANTRVCVLDAHLQLVPVGVPGELHVSGVGLARGYLHQPELTAEKFIPDLFSGEPGVRLYKTGDLARYLPDGNLEFLGRLDHQVKVRGFRIELGEIEAVLNQHAAVRETVILARGDMPGDKRLVAYVVPQAGQVLAVGDLRRFLQDQLPNYMVPAAFVFLDALPLTPSGKVDRRALPAFDGERPQLETTYVPPQTEIEKQIAAVLQEILHVDQVGLFDNFFDLGGHSLLLVQLQSKLQASFGREIPILQLFRHSTTRDLAKYLSQATAEKPVLSHVEERGRKYRQAFKHQQRPRRQERSPG